VVRNAISVDVEDWFQVGAFETVIHRKDWGNYEHRVEANTDAVLALFADAGVKATFFTLGWVAERYPALIRRMVEQGHEVASHGCDHKRVFQMTAAEFLADIKASKTVLEQAAGEAVKGYRAPNFSIDTRTPWAHEALVEAGYQYSSSVAPIKHDHYGWPEAPRFAFRPVAGSELIELPVSTVQVAGRNFAAGGGGFFRLLPYALSRWMVERVNAEDRPSIFYFHPWDMDPGQPRVANAPLKSKLRHYPNLGVMADKLRRLTKDFEWGRVDQVIDAEHSRLQ
jgi:polysaccharide deacetylase family protein (PEP-CTERM system associated)